MAGSAIELRSPASDSNHTRAVDRFGQAHEHHADGTQSDDRDGIARLHTALLQAANDARQWFHQRRILIPHPFGDDVGVTLHDARRNANVLRVRPVIEQQVLAQILQPAMAEETLAARRGIGRHHALPDREIPDVLADCHYISRQFVTEHRGGYDHPRVVAAPEDFYVGTACQRYLDAYQNVSALDRRNGYRLYLQMLLAVKHSSHHVVIHYDHLCG